MGYDIIFKGYKCFKDVTSINDIKPINIFIGRNNVGKSSVIDVIGYVNNEIKQLSSNTEVCESILLDDDIISAGFDRNTRLISGSLNMYNSYYQYGSQFLNKSILRKIINHSNRQEYDIPSIKTDLLHPFTSQWHNNWKTALEHGGVKRRVFKRIFAERDVYPEIDSGSQKIYGSGEGITRLINMYLNYEKYDEKIIRVNLLDRLNQIMGSDAHFIGITTQKISDGQSQEWEIFLEEEEKGRVALSKSGSGLKTIIMILVYTIVLPELEKEPLNNYAFAFEEIENNLHPALLRRVIRYLKDVSEKGAQLFLTTHSNVMIDAFDNDNYVSIYNVCKENGNHTIKHVSNYNEINKCLDELGSKASDLLQSNGIIWVEGPSDRIYINKWIELWSEGKYREGANYQCAIYGGKILADVEFDEKTTEEFINLLNINRNSMIIMDSDKDSDEDNLRKTKNRIIDECNKYNILNWVTKGREIENYISSNVFNKTYDIKADKEIGQYQKICEYLNTYKPELGDKYIDKKFSNSLLLCKNMVIDDVKDFLDLNEKMNKVIDQVKRWNE